MPTTLITADNLFAIKLEPGLEEILDTGGSDKSDKNEKSDIGEPGECLEVGGEDKIEGEEEEGFSFYDANAPKVTKCKRVGDCCGFSFSLAFLSYQFTNLKFDIQFITHLSSI